MFDRENILIQILLWWAGIEVGILKNNKEKE